MISPREWNPYNFYVPARCPNSHPEGAPFEHYGTIQSEEAIEHVVVILRASELPFERWAVPFDLKSVPVPVDLVVYTEEEWARLRRERHGRSPRGPQKPGV